MKKKKKKKTANKIISSRGKIILPHFWGFESITKPGPYVKPNG